MSFEKLAGIYVYCMDYHSGQGSRLYRLLSRIDAHLTDRAISSIRDGSDSGMWDESHDVYEHLKARGAQ